MPSHFQERRGRCTGKKEVNPTKNSTIKTLEKIKGINLPQALEMFSGNEGLYLTVLREFVAECKANLKDIEDGMNALDTQKAIGAAHKLKGTASNVFVRQVYERAKDLELTLRKFKDLTSESAQAEIIKLYKMFKALEAAAEVFMESVENVSPGLKRGSF